MAIYGEPGAYVGLSGLDYPFYGLQAGNELTYAKVHRCKILCQCIIYILCHVFIYI